MQTKGHCPLFRGWDVALGPYTPTMWGLSKSERRRHGAEMLYELEMGFRKQGWPSEEFVYDAEREY